MTDKPVASVSFDLDNVWSYLKTHGDPEWIDRPSYLAAAHPRMVDFLGETAVVSTVFAIGADVVRDDGAEAVRALAAAGHEIGNHSFEHEPWLQRYSKDRLAAEIDDTHDAIVAAGAPAPRGFRGPGYSTSPVLQRLLAQRGYTYDASTLPTWIGPLARAHHFRSTNLTQEQREERAELFGGFSQARLPLRPYTTEGGAIVELPVTTMPLMRIPIHGSYLIQLYAGSPALARTYFRTAVRLCRLRGVGMSMLLHPTDLLDSSDAPARSFFPGMSVRAADKHRFMTWVLETMKSHFDVIGTGAHVARFRDTVSQ